MSTRVNRERTSVAVFTEVELLLEIFSKLYRRIEFAAHFAAKTFKRTHSAVGQQYLDFGATERTTRHRFPDDQFTRTAFERAIILLERSTSTARTFHIQWFKIS